MKKILLLTAMLVTFRAYARESGDEETKPKIILTGYYAKSFKAGGLFYPRKSFGFGVGSTFAKDRMFVEFDMKLKDQLSYTDVDDTVRTIDMSTIVFRTGWNTRILRASLISGPIIGPQGGYGFTLAGDENLANNPYFAGLYLQFNLNYPGALSLKFGDVDNAFYPGIFLRPSYNFLMNTENLGKSKAKFHGMLEFGVNLLIGGN